MWLLVADLEHAIRRGDADARGGAARRCRGGRGVDVRVGVRDGRGGAVLRSLASHVSPWGKFCLFFFGGGGGWLDVFEVFTCTRATGRLGIEQGDSAVLYIDGC